MNLYFESADDKALSTKLYDASSLDPYLAVSTMAKKKFITKNNAMKWQISTSLNYITTNEFDKLKEKLYSLDADTQLPQLEHSAIHDENVDILNSENDVSILLSSKRQSTEDQNNIVFMNKKVKIKNEVGLSQECTYTTNDPEIIESEDDAVDEVLNSGYIRSETLLTFTSETADNKIILL